ncbi:hypothetical protein ODZ84_02390 [Chryseobacterium fluminis]|uniref:hypothetical protein n=1 Tax=Chryseobacterium fluminis TaxID=2983606 RepID=UPI002255737A|nr:hypothetical protein [Chryseobacterium sp. MMS21-Ot14]UZT98440.1 hypothetical protein ODZ84_02390 [Chryseobacterium sp. MMS21-Ot14]
MFKLIQKKSSDKISNFGLQCKTNNLELINKDKIEKWILPHLSRGKRGFSMKFDLAKIIQTMIKRLKTGCQWRELSVKDYFGEENNAEVIVPEENQRFSKNLRVLLLRKVIT